MTSSVIAAGRSSRELDTLPAAGRGNHAKAFLGQKARHQVVNHRVVVDDQDRIRAESACARAGDDLQNAPQAPLVHGDSVGFRRESGR